MCFVVLTTEKDSSVPGFSAGAVYPTFLSGSKSEHILNYVTFLFKASRSNPYLIMSLSCMCSMLFYLVL